MTHQIQTHDERWTIPIDAQVYAHRMIYIYSSTIDQLGSSKLIRLIDLVSSDDITHQMTHLW